MKHSLKEFFEPMVEGPTDPTFQAAPTVKPMDAAGQPGMDTLAPDTQDVAKMSATSLSFFSKNVQSAASKFQLEGFDSSGLQAFAASLDDAAYNLYGQVQNPQARQKFEAEYQKIAADWSTDLTKLLEKVARLAGHVDIV